LWPPESTTCCERGRRSLVEAIWWWTVVVPKGRRRHHHLSVKELRCGAMRHDVSQHCLIPSSEAVLCQKSHTALSSVCFCPSPDVCLRQLLTIRSNHLTSIVYPHSTHQKKKFMYIYLDIPSKGLNLELGRLPPYDRYNTTIGLDYK